LAFGMEAGTDLMPTKMMKMSLTKQLTHFEYQQRMHPRLSEVQDPSIEGRDPQVTTVREGEKFIVGGNITFEPGSADLNDEAKDRLVGVSDIIKGYRNKIELRGHAGSAELHGSGPYNDLWLLSHARAHAAMDFLVREQGIAADRFRLIATAGKEPLRQRVVTAQGQTPNRRVEVVVTEALVEQFQEPQPGAGEQDIR